MTESSNTPVDPSLKAWLENWHKCLQEVISQVAGHPVTFEASAAPLPIAESDLCSVVVASGALRGEMTLRITSGCAVQLARISMAEDAGADLTPERKEAVEELLRKVTERAATSVSQPGGEVQLQISAASVPSWPAATALTLQATGDDSLISIEIKVSAALAAALRSAPDAATRPTVANTPSSYDRFLDVPLEVKIRFGSRRMLLRDVLALSTGAVLELDRNLQSAVDLILDGRVIAQGEVVVVDGKYGLRVTNVFRQTSLS
jgi:flagellar motor switch protein FliN/FliY